MGAKYLLKETPTSNYPQRTEWNVRDSDGTVIFSLASALIRDFRDPTQEAVPGFKSVAAGNMTQHRATRGA